MRVCICFEFSSIIIFAPVYVFQFKEREEKKHQAYRVAYTWITKKIKQRDNNKQKQASKQVFIVCINGD